MLLRWGLTVLVVAAAIPVCGAFLEWRSLRRDAKRFPPTGRMLHSGTRQLHVVESGPVNAIPVILEAGLAASSVSWSPVQQTAPTGMRVVSYDRAGLGWSTPLAKGPTLNDLIDDLRMVVLSVARDSRVILVGHSFGGLLVRVFAERFPGRVAGLVLVDPVSISYWADCGPADRRRLLMGARLSRRGAVLAQLGLVRLCLTIVATGRTALPKMVARASAGPGNHLLARLTSEMRRLPRELWPTVMSHWSRASSFRVMAAYLDLLPVAAAEAAATRMPSELPATVLSAGTATPAEISERDAWVQQGRAGRHVLLPDCTHWIQLQRPDAVVDAIDNLLPKVTA